MLKKKEEMKTDGTCKMLLREIKNVSLPEEKKSPPVEMTGHV